MSTGPSWDDHRIFLAVLEGGSLAGAARALGVSHPTVRSRIESLEKALGTVLFTRSVNGLAPTEAAEALREAARTMANAADLFRRQASAPDGEIAGSVRLSVPEIMGVETIPAMLQPLLETYPRLHVELALSNAQADVLAHEVDIAVRTVTPSQGSLIARRIARHPLGLFASPAYIARNGMPTSIADLSRHTLIGPDRTPPTWRLPPDSGRSSLLTVLRCEPTVTRPSFRRRAAVSGSPSVPCRWPQAIRAWCASSPVSRPMSSTFGR